MESGWIEKINQDLREEYTRLFDEGASQGEIDSVLEGARNLSDSCLDFLIAEAVEWMRMDSEDYSVKKQAA